MKKKKCTPDPTTLLAVVRKSFGQTMLPSGGIVRNEWSTENEKK